MVLQDTKDPLDIKEQRCHIILLNSMLDISNMLLMQIYTIWNKVIVYTSNIADAHIIFILASYSLCNFGL